MADDDVARSDGLAELELAIGLTRWLVGRGGPSSAGSRPSAGCFTRRPTLERRLRRVLGQWRGGEVQVALLALRSYAASSRALRREGAARCIQAAARSALLAARRCAVATAAHRRAAARCALRRLDARRASRLRLQAMRGAAASTAKRLVLWRWLTRATSAAALLRASISVGSWRERARLTLALLCLASHADQTRARLYIHGVSSTAREASIRRQLALATAQLAAFARAHVAAASDAAFRRRWALRRAVAHLAEHARRAASRSLASAAAAASAAARRRRRSLSCWWQRSLALANRRHMLRRARAHADAAAGARGMAAWASSHRAYSAADARTALALSRWRRVACGAAVAAWRHRHPSPPPEAVASAAAARAAAAAALCQWRRWCPPLHAESAALHRAIHTALHTSPPSACTHEQERGSRCGGGILSLPAGPVHRSARGGVHTGSARVPWLDGRGVSWLLSALGAALPHAAGASRHACGRSVAGGVGNTGGGGGGTTSGGEGNGSSRTSDDPPAGISSSDDGGVRTAPTGIHTRASSAHTHLHTLPPATVEASLKAEMPEKDEGRIEPTSSPHTFRARPGAGAAVTAAATERLRLWRGFNRWCALHAARQRLRRAAASAGAAPRRRWRQMASAHGRWRLHAILAAAATRQGCRLTSVALRSRHRAQLWAGLAALRHLLAVARRRELEHFRRAFRAAEAAARSGALAGGSVAEGSSYRAALLPEGIAASRLTGIGGGARADAGATAGAGASTATRASGGGASQPRIDPASTAASVAAAVVSSAAVGTATHRAAALAHRSMRRQAQRVVLRAWRLTARALAADRRRAEEAAKRAAVARWQRRARAAGTGRAETAAHRHLLCLHAWRRAAAASRRRGAKADAAAKLCAIGETGRCLRRWRASFSAARAASRAASALASASRACLLRLGWDALCAARCGAQHQRGLWHTACLGHLRALLTAWTLHAMQRRRDSAVAACAAPAAAAAARRRRLGALLSWQAAHAAGRLRARRQTVGRYAHLRRCLARARAGASRQACAAACRAKLDAMSGASLGWRLLHALALTRPPFGTDAARRASRHRRARDVRSGFRCLLRHAVARLTHARLRVAPALAHARQSALRRGLRMLCLHALCRAGGSALRAVCHRRCAAAAVAAWRCRSASLLHQHASILRARHHAVKAAVAAGFRRLCARAAQAAAVLWRSRGRIREAGLRLGVDASAAASVDAFRVAMDASTASMDVSGTSVEASMAPVDASMAPVDISTPSAPSVDASVDSMAAFTPFTDVSTSVEAFVHPSPAPTRSRQPAAVESGASEAARASEAERGDRAAVAGGRPACVEHSAAQWMGFHSRGSPPAPNPAPAVVGFGLQVQSAAGACREASNASSGACGGSLDAGVASLAGAWWAQDTGGGGTDTSTEWWAGTGAERRSRARRRGGRAARVGDGVGEGLHACAQASLRERLSTRGQSRFGEGLRAHGPSSSGEGLAAIRGWEAEPPAALYPLPTPSGGDFSAGAFLRPLTTSAGRLLPPDHPPHPPHPTRSLSPSTTATPRRLEAWPPSPPLPEVEPRLSPREQGLALDRTNPPPLPPQLPSPPPLLTTTRMPVFGTGPPAPPPHAPPAPPPAAASVSSIAAPCSPALPSGATSNLAKPYQAVIYTSLDCAGWRADAPPLLPTPSRVAASAPLPPTPRLTECYGCDSAARALSFSASPPQASDNRQPHVTPAAPPPPLSGVAPRGADYAARQGHPTLPLRPAGEGMPGPPPSGIAGSAGQQARTPPTVEPSPLSSLDTEFAEWASLQPRNGPPPAPATASRNPPQSASKIIASAPLPAPRVGSATATATARPAVATPANLSRATPASVHSTWAPLASEDSHAPAAARAPRVPSAPVGSPLDSEFRSWLATHAACHASGSHDPSQAIPEPALAEWDTGPHLRSALARELSSLVGSPRAQHEVTPPWATADAAPHATLRSGAAAARGGGGYASASARRTLSYDEDHNQGQAPKCSPKCAQPMVIGRYC
jgi:hypothetical protein